MNDETRRERIVLETERHRIVGDVTLPAEGYRSRLSDLLNREGFAFVPLANAIITGINGSKDVTEMAFIAVARDHIQIAYEEGLNGIGDEPVDLERIEDEDSEDDSSDRLV
jgi:hypothetical protein